MKNTQTRQLTALHILIVHSFPESDVTVCATVVYLYSWCKVIDVQQVTRELTRLTYKYETTSTYVVGKEFKLQVTKNNNLAN